MSKQPISEAMLDACLECIGEEPWTDDEKIVIAKHFFSRCAADVTLERVAMLLGVTRERANQLQKQGIAKARADRALAALAGASPVPYAYSQRDPAGYAAKLERRRAPAAEKAAAKAASKRERRERQREYSRKSYERLKLAGGEKYEAMLERSRANNARWRAEHG